MKTCLICGSEFTDDKFFCPDCGTKLEEIPVNQAADHGAASERKSVPEQESGSERKSASEHKSTSAQEPGSEQKSARIPEPEATSKPSQASVSKPKSLSVLPIVILSILSFVCFIAATFFFFKMNDYSRRLNNSRQAENSLRRESEQARSELEQIKSELAECQKDLEQAQLDWAMAEFELKKFDGLQGLYGYGSDNYYAQQSVVVLQEFESKEVTIYGNLGGTYSAKRSGNGITWEWSREWEGHKTQATITGNSVGYYTINMSNDQSSDSFEILVIVTDKELSVK